MKTDTGILNKTKFNNMEKEYTPTSMRFHYKETRKFQHVKSKK